MRKSNLSLWLGVASTALLATTAFAETPARPKHADIAASALSATVKREAIEAASKMLIDEYVFPDVGAKAASMLKNNLAAGKYDSAATAIAFAAQVTQDLQDLSHDKHLNVFADGAFPDDNREPLPPSLFGFARADRLQGNIGYIELNNFMWHPLLRLGAAQAMAATNQTDALIIDLRRNDGGDAAAVVYLIGFFFDGSTPVKVSDILWRKRGTSAYDRQAFKTEPTPSVYRDKPVYILIGPNTFSAAEHFAYDMQALKRATVVGQVSKGGANPGGPKSIGPGLVLALPRGRSDNPITGGNWEGKGVQPDIRTAPDQTFATAYALALKTSNRSGPAATTPDAVVEARLLPPPRTKPVPGADAALRHFIASMAEGRVPDDIVGDPMKWFAGLRMAAYQADLKRLGTLKNVVFVEVDDLGQDVYEASFDNGALVFSVAMELSGKIAATQYRPK